MFPSAVHAAPRPLAVRQCKPTFSFQCIVSIVPGCEGLLPVMLEARFGGSSFHHRSSSRNFPRASSPRVSSKITNNFGDGPRSPRLSRYTGQRGKLLNLPSPFLLPSFLPFAFLTRNILPPRIFRILCLPRGFHLLGRGIIEIRREYTLATRERMPHLNGTTAFFTRPYFEGTRFFRTVKTVPRFFSSARESFLEKRGKKKKKKKGQVSIKNRTIYQRSNFRNFSLERH